jgi:GntR family transcriptional regulator
MAYEVAAPKYVRLAQTIQRRIEDGTYPPGTRVPSENQLVQAFGMSRPTVVRALELLKRDGWLESRQGYGTIVRGRPEVVEQKGRRGLEALDRDESKASGRLVEVGDVPVPERVASVLGLPKRAEVLMRRFLVEEDGEAVELVSSYFPAGLVDGTELANAEALRGSAREHLEARQKVRFDHVTERVSARLPESGEAELLGGMPDGVPVLSVLVIACDASGQALQVSEVLLPADLHELEDTYRLN